MLNPSQQHDFWLVVWVKLGKGEANREIGDPARSGFEFTQAGTPALLTAREAIARLLLFSLNLCNLRDLQIF